MRLRSRGLDALRWASGALILATLLGAPAFADDLELFYTGTTTTCCQAAEAKLTQVCTSGNLEWECTGQPIPGGDPLIGGVAGSSEGYKFATVTSTATCTYFAPVCGALPGTCLPAAQQASVTCEVRQATGPYCFWDPEAGVAYGDPDCSIEEEDPNEETANSEDSES